MSILIGPGADVSVSGNRSNIVVQAFNAGDAIVCHLGTINPAGIIDWRAESAVGDGLSPSIAINDQGHAICAYSRSGWFSHKTYFCKLGYIDGFHLKFGAEIDLTGSVFSDDRSFSSSVALNDKGYFFFMYQRGGVVVSYLGYSFGRISFNQNNHPQDLMIFDRKDDFDTGIQPSCAINNKNEIVEVHQTQAIGSNSLYYSARKIVDNKLVDLVLGTQYATGSMPCIAFTDDNNIFECHNSQSSSEIWCIRGALNNGSIERLIGTDFLLENLECSSSTVDKVRGLGVATGSRYVIVASYFAQLGLPYQVNGIFYWPIGLKPHSGRAWMTDIYSKIQNRSLYQIAIPGSHDSGTYEHNFLALTQTQNLRQQLDSGMRFFDLRPECNDASRGAAGFVIHHTFQGVSWQPLLNDILGYMSERTGTERELIILKIAMFKAFTNEIHHSFIAILESVLGPHLVPHNQKDFSLNDSTLEQTLSSAQGAIRSRIAILYDWNFEGYGPLPDGFFQLAPAVSADNRVVIYDDYSNDDDINIMRTDQLQKLQANSAVGGRKGQLFLLSWTLTASLLSRNSIKNLMDISAVAKPAAAGLLSFFADGSIWKNKTFYNKSKDPMVNIILVDFCNLTQALELAVMINQS